MFKNLNCKKFYFADDGNLTVTVDTETQVFLNCQNILKQLERCSKNRRIAVNGDRTSIIYLNSENTHAPNCFGKAAKSPETKNPVLDCGQQTEFQRTPTVGRRKVVKQLNILKMFCSPNWCLKQPTLIKLYRTLVLPQTSVRSPCVGELS